MVGLARPSDALASLRDAAEHKELALVPIAVDVTVPAEVPAAVDLIDTGIGPVTFAVTCAGTAEVIGPAWDADPELWWQAVGVDLRGKMLTARSVLSWRLVRVPVVWSPCMAISATASPATCRRSLSPRPASRGSPRCGPRGERHRRTGLRDPPGLRADTDDRASRLERRRRAWLFGFGAAAEDDPRPAADLLEAIALGAANQLPGPVLHVRDDLAELTERRRTDPTLRRLRLDLR